jgi:hypothetical protein
MQMKIRYSYALLTYVHDAVTREFAVVGVLLFAPGEGVVTFRGTSLYSRLSEFFPGMDGEHFRKMVKSIESRLKELADTTLTLQPQATSVLDLAHSILPQDDSTLRFVKGGNGVTKNLDTAFDRIYERFVERYTRRQQSQRRSDAMVLNAFKPLLAKRNLLHRVEPVVIKAKDYEHQFPIAWQNGKLSACEAISLDFADGAYVVEKANTWLGRGVSLSDAKDKFKLYLLVGKPRSEKLQDSFNRALHILDKMPLEHELVREEEAPKFVEHIEKELTH